MIKRWRLLQLAIVQSPTIDAALVARYLSRHAGKSVTQAVLVSSVVPFMLKTNDNPNGTEQAVFDTITYIQ